MITCTNEARRNTTDSIVIYCMTILIIILNTSVHKADMSQQCNKYYCHVSTVVVVNALVKK